MEQRNKEQPKPSMLLVLSVCGIIAALIMFGVLKWGVDIHPVLLAGICIVVASGVIFLKLDYRTLEESMINSVLIAMQSLFIMWTVGVIIGTWITSGVVPSMIYYGLKILSPGIFLFASFFICSIVSVATGTSWGTVGTIGLALLGISMGLDMSAPMVAGAVISGAYFGDKMSPLSDTTILAPAVAGSDLFMHIRAMLWTTGPTYVIVSVVLIFIGMTSSSGELEMGRINTILAMLDGEFWISPIALICPVVVIILSIRKTPALPAVWTGIIISLVFMVIQGRNIPDLFNAMQYGYVPALSGALADGGEAVAKFLSETGIAATSDVVVGAAKDIVRLVKRGGMQSMNWTTSLMVTALAFGGAMEACGFFTALLNAIMKRVNSLLGLVTATGISSILGNALLGDAYLSIVIPGRIFKPAYDEKGLHPMMLSRTLEDFGTLTAGIIPWCSGGVFCAGALGVPTLEYAPYAFLLWMNPLMAILITALGIGIFWRGKDDVPVRGGKTKPAGLDA